MKIRKATKEYNSCKIDIRGQYHKTFFLVTDDKLECFSPGKTSPTGEYLCIFVIPFHSSLIFVGKVGAYPIEEPFRCSTLG
jgi:hypothetical protein